MNLPLARGLQWLPALLRLCAVRTWSRAGAACGAPCAVCASPQHLCRAPASPRTAGHGGQEGTGQPARLTAVAFFLFLFFFPSLVPLSPGSSSDFNERFVEAELSEPFKREMSSGRRNAESSFHQPGPRRRLRGMSGQL